MPDYSPKYKPGYDVTFSASADVIGGQLVFISGTNTVAPTTTSTPAWFGIARQDAKTGERVVVTRSGVQSPKAAGTIAAGDRVIPAASGTVATIAGGNAAHTVGTALSAAIAGAAVLVAFDR